MSRTLESLPIWAEVGHPRLHLPGPWVSERMEDAQGPEWDDEADRMNFGRYDSTSEDSEEPDMDNGSRPFHKVYRVDISHFPAYRIAFMQDEEFHWERDEKESQETWEERYAIRKRAAEDDREKYFVPVRVEVYGHRRFRSDWLHYKNADRRSMHLEVEHPDDWAAYAAQLDRERTELLSYDVYLELFGLLPVRHDQKKMRFAEPPATYYFSWMNRDLRDLLWDMYKRAQYGRPLEISNWPQHNSSWSRPVQPFRLFRQDVFQKEASDQWGPASSVQVAQRVPFRYNHQLFVMTKKDAETSEGEGVCYTINV